MFLLFSLPFLHPFSSPISLPADLHFWRRWRHDIHGTHGMRYSMGGQNEYHHMNTSRKCPFSRAQEPPGPYTQSTQLCSLSESTLAESIRQRCTNVMPLCHCAVLPDVRLTWSSPTDSHECLENEVLHTSCLFIARNGDLCCTETLSQLHDEDKISFQRIMLAVLRILDELA